VIEPIDDAERRQLLRELVQERFGRRPRRRTRAEDSPEVIAERRRVLCGIEDADTWEAA
jgi:hypothetical protein